MTCCIRPAIDVMLCCLIACFRCLQNVDMVNIATLCLAPIIGVLVQDPATRTSFANLSGVKFTELFVANLLHVKKFQRSGRRQIIWSKPQKWRFKLFHINKVI
jgi:hypothetical protein